MPRHQNCTVSVPRQCFRLVRWPYAQRRGIKHINPKSNSEVNGRFLCSKMRNIVSGIFYTLNANFEGAQ